jgi:hypothetical protein
MTTSLMTTGTRQTTLLHQMPLLDTTTRTRKSLLTLRSMSQPATAAAVTTAMMTVTPLWANHLSTTQPSPTLALTFPPENGE